MALTITIQSYHKDIAELRTMLTDYTLDGGTVLRGPGNDRILPLDADGESALTQAQYDTLCLDPVIRFDGGTFYVNVTAARVSELVPAYFPNSTYPIINEGDVPVQKTLAEYSSSCLECVDGSYKVRCLTYTDRSFSKSGLTNEDRILWEAEFTTLLVKGEGELLPLVV